MLPRDSKRRERREDDNAKFGFLRVLVGHYSTENVIIEFTIKHSHKSKTHGNMNVLCSNNEDGKPILFLL